MRRKNAGVAYVLAMLFLILFTVLAVGFCAATTLSVQIAKNDRSAADAQAAAESGLQFVRYQLSCISIPNETDDRGLLAVVGARLGKSLNGSSNMEGRSIEIADNMIYLPAADHFIVLDPTIGSKFHAQISARDSSIWVKVTGYGSSPNIGRAIQLEFRRTRQSDDGDKLIAVPGSYEEVAP